MKGRPGKPEQTGEPRSLIGGTGTDTRSMAAGGPGFARAGPVAQQFHEAACAIHAQGIGHVQLGKSGIARHLACPDLPMGGDHLTRHEGRQIGIAPQAQDPLALRAVSRPQAAPGRRGSPWLLPCSHASSRSGAAPQARCPRQTGTDPGPRRSELRACSEEGPGPCRPTLAGQSDPCSSPEPPGPLCQLASAALLCARK